MVKLPAMAQVMKISFGVMMVVASVGCRGGVRLTHAPNLYLIEGPAAYDRVPEAQRSRNPQIVYVTDREVEQESDQGPEFGSKRSFHVRYGLATVDLGPGTWDELVETSTQRSTSKIPMSITRTDPAGEFSFEPTNYSVMPDGSLGYNEQGTRIVAEQTEQFTKFLSGRMQQANSGDVYVIVHGFSVTFPGSLYTATHVWHYLGRPGVAIAYSWPSGHSGLLRGYTYDRESSEFTVTHFKNVLKAIAACPDVKRVHVIGHSRGTQVVADAVRELHLASQAKGKHTYEEVKLGTVVLAAPDMDWGVFRQRFIGDNATSAPRTLVIYVSPHDDAIGISGWLFSSGRRLGRLVGADITTAGQGLLHQTDRIQVINCEVSGFGTTHNYFYGHPAALSDVILVLRDGRKPGAENGRPLVQGSDGLWQITNDYLSPNKPSPKPKPDAATAPAQPAP